MKQNIIILFLILRSACVTAQTLTQSADGKGSLILPLNGVAIGFDIGKTEISLGANNYSRALRNDSIAFHKWFFGGNLSVQNSSGIGNLFRNGDIVPASNCIGFLGLNINNNHSILKDWNKSGVVLYNDFEKLKLKKLFESYRIDVINYGTTSLLVIEDSASRVKMKEILTQKIENAPDYSTLRLNIISILTNKDKEFESFIYSFKSLIEPREKIYYASYSMEKADKYLDSTYNDFIDKHIVKRFSPFIFGGIDARNFSLYSGLNDSAFAKSFTDTLYRGGQFGIGINGQIGSWWLGITFAYVNGDNFSNLSSKEYTLRTTDTSRNQSLISEKKITGFSGKYAKVENNQVNIDLLKEFKLGDTSRLITNLYYRGALFSRDTAFLKNTSNIGLGIYFLGKKSKFLGGLYVELPDINNSIEKSKPESEQSIRPPFKKLTFGVVTKFSLASILGFNDRPRKPD